MCQVGLVSQCVYVHACICTYVLTLRKVGVSGQPLSHKDGWYNHADQ